MATIYYLTWHHTGPTEHGESTERFHEYHQETPARLSQDEFDDLYEEVGAYDLSAEAQDVMEAAEDVWRAYNRGSGDEAPEFLEKEIRSMSVGDIVEIDGAYFMAAAVGFNRVEINGGEA